MYPCDRPIRAAISSDVPWDKAMAPQSVHDIARSPGHSLFFCVRRRLILPISSSLPSKCAVLPTELTVTFCHSVFLSALVNALAASGKIPTGWQADLFVILQYVPMFTLSPRFMQRIRELYARDVQGRRGEWIDTGFGLSSGRGAGRSAIVFADVEQSEGSEDIEEVPRGVATTSSSGRGAGGMATGFADVEQNEGSDNIEEVTREVQVTTRSE